MVPGIEPYKANFEEGVHGTQGERLMALFLSFLFSLDTEHASLVN
jgi:hypothetical protein